MKKALLLGFIVIAAYVNAGEKMKLILDKEIDIYPTKECFIDSLDMTKHFGVIFEIDDATAYLYAIVMDNKQPEILDACHVYNIKNLTDGDIKSTIKIAWSENYQYAVLFINDYAHVLFDFKNKQGYCRTGFPILNKDKSEWSKKDKHWNEEIFSQFK